MPRTGAHAGKSIWRLCVCVQGGPAARGGAGDRRRGALVAQSVPAAHAATRSGGTVQCTRQQCELANSELVTHSPAPLRWPLSLPLLLLARIECCSRRSFRNPRRPLSPPSTWQAPTYSIARSKRSKSNPNYAAYSYRLTFRIVLTLRCAYTLRSFHLYCTECTEYSTVQLQAILCYTVFIGL